MGEMPCNGDDDQDDYDSNQSDNFLTCGSHLSSPQRKSKPHISAGHPIIVSEKCLFHVEIMKQLSLRCRVTSGSEDDAAGYDNYFALCLRGVAFRAFLSVRVSSKARDRAMDSSSFLLRICF